MARIRTFQALVIVSAIFYLAWFSLPYVPMGYAPKIQTLLSYNSYGASSFVQSPLFYLAIGIGKLVATLGLLLFLSWGRWLLVAVVTTSVASVPFSGITISAPLDTFIGSLTVFTDGAIIALSFSSPIAERWRKDE